MSIPVFPSYCSSPHHHSHHHSTPTKAAAAPLLSYAILCLCPDPLNTVVRYLLAAARVVVEYTAINVLAVTTPHLKIISYDTPTTYTNKK